MRFKKTIEKNKNTAARERKGSIARNKAFRKLFAELTCLHVKKTVERLFVCHFFLSLPIQNKDEHL